MSTRKEKGEQQLLASLVVNKFANKPMCYLPEQLKWQLQMPRMLSGEVLWFPFFHSSRKHHPPL